MKFKEIKLVGGWASHNHSFALEPLSCLSGSLSTKCRQGHTHRHSSAVPFVSTRGEGKKKNSLAAFTLAEVLVTLGIIGVVSAMTVPTLMQNYQRQSYVTQLHKVYNELTQAFLQFKNDRNAIWLSEAGHVRHQDMMPFMKQYFKVVQDCGKTSTPCFASSYKNLSGSTFELTTKDEDATYYGVLASGASFGIKSDGIDTGTNYTDDFLYRIAIDVNGQKGPNIYGRDLFILYIFSDGVVDAYRVNPDCRENNNCTLGANPSEHREKLYESCASSTGNTWYDGCFAKILNDNWEMNY